jgi:hypothetical protein
LSWFLSLARYLVEITCHKPFSSGWWFQGKKLGAKIILKIATGWAIDSCELEYIVGADHGDRR